MRNILFKLALLVSFSSFGQSTDFKNYVSTKENKFKSSKKANIAYNKGSRFFDIGDFDNAIAQFTITIEDDKKQKYFSTDAYIGRASAYTQINDLTSTINDYSEIINFEKDPLYLIIAFVGRGTTYGYLGNFDKAIDDFKMAIGLEPNSVDALYNLSRLYLQISDSKNALKYSIKAEKNYKNQKLNNPLLFSSICYNKGVAKYSLNISTYCDDFMLSVKFKNSMSKEQLQFIENVCH
tara:strand:- start:908 stop:1618 length:711 start_codon:yes stop_codon:yes gene_type:complete